MTCPHCKREIDSAALLIAARGTLSQAEAARVLNVHRQNINAWEQGRRVPRNLAGKLEALRAAGARGAAGAAG